MRKTTLLIVAILMAFSHVSAGTGWYEDFLTIKVNGVETPNNYYLGTDPTTGATAFQGKSFGTVSSLELSDISLKYWADNGDDRTGGALYYKIMSADGTTQIVAPFEIMWAHASIGGNNYQGTKPAGVGGSMSFLKGLSSGTYQLHIWAKSWGTGGDSYLSNNTANYVATFTVNRPVTISGTLSNIDDTYETLKTAFDSINAHKDYSNKDIEIKIAGNTTETASAVLNQPITATWNTLTIYPTTAGVTVSGNFANALIDLNGADKVTITGKLNKTGAPKSLTLMQQETTNNASSTIRFINDAKNNNISYCILKGSCQGTTSGGIIYFTTSVSTTGNSDNTISYNDFNRAGVLSPLNAIYSNGTSATTFNAKNTIDNNNFFNLYDGLSSQYCVRLGLYNAEFTITNNSFYEPNEVVPTGTGNYSPINIGASTPGEKFNISNNYIGGSEPLCAGLPLRKTNAYSNTVWCMFVSISSTLITNPSNIQGNVIKNISWKNNTSSKKDFTCIQSFGGNMNIGTTVANTISDISVENGAISTSVFYGINVQNSTSLYTVRNNTISNITISNPDGVHGSSFYGLYKSSSAGEVNFSNNVIGGTTANNINVTGTSTANSQLAVGVYIAGNNAAKVTISGNIIRNINNSSSRTDATNSTYGVYINSTAANGSINGNTIFGLTASDATLPARVIGVNMDATSTSAATICANNMITLGNTNPGLVYGILQNTGLGKVYHNSVYLAGSPATGSFESSALNVTGATAGREFLNNILYNTRSNTGTASSKHYVAKFNATANLISIFNVVSVPVTSSGQLTGALSTTDYATLSDWKTGTTLDAASQARTVYFINSAVGDLRLISPSIQDGNLAVTQLGTVLTDMFNTPRPSTTYAGAYEAVGFPVTGIDKTTMNSNLRTSKTGIEVVLDNVSAIELYNASGLLIDKTRTNGIYSRSLKNGVYIININGTATKFVK